LFSKHYSKRFCIEKMSLIINDLHSFKIQNYSFRIKSSNDEIGEQDMDLFLYMIWAGFEMMEY